MSDTKYEIGKKAKEEELKLVQKTFNNSIS